MESLFSAGYKDYIKLKYKLIISDVDGTLLDDSHRITEENKKAVAEYRKAGGLFSLATGRIEKTAINLHTELSLDLPLILYNGAKIVDLKNNSTIYEKHLTREQAESALKALSSYPVSVIFYCDGEGYTTEYTNNIKVHADMEGILPNLSSDMAEVDLSRVNKILFAGNDDEGDDLLFAGYLREYEKLCPVMPFIVRSNKKYLEILPEGVNKGAAVEFLARHLGIKIDEVMCFGDNLNDFEMIEKAGLGVAMGNGHDALKKIAGLVAPANTESGVAAVIRRYL